jgi:hypothetical protein
MNVIRNAPRHLRSYLHRTLDKENRPLWLLSPKDTGDKLWRFGVIYGGKMILLFKGIAKRDDAREHAKRVFGMTAKEIKRPKRMKDAA